VLSIGRRKQARVMSNTYCRLLPGDVVELLYDQQGRYAYKVSGGGGGGGGGYKRETMRARG
jgi:hypothetical protein